MTSTTSTLTTMGRADCIEGAGKRVAIAMKSAYQCDGMSFRQDNEPAGNQDVWHYHPHVFPCWTGDDLFGRYDESRIVTVEERRPFAEKLRSALDTGSSLGLSLEGASVAPLNPEQWQELRAIRLDAWRAKLHAFSSSYEETLTRPDDDWHRRLANDLSVHMVVRSRGQPIGMVGGYLGSDNGDESVAFVFGMYVNQKFHGKGVGRTLRRSLIDRPFAESRVTAIRLWVSEPQDRARRPHELVGFRVVGRPEDSSGNELIMKGRGR